MIGNTSNNSCNLENIGKHFGEENCVQISTIHSEPSCCQAHFCGHIVPGLDYLNRQQEPTKTAREAESQAGLGKLWATGTRWWAVLLVGSSFQYQAPNKEIGIALVTSNLSLQGKSKRGILREGACSGTLASAGADCVLPTDTEPRWLQGLTTQALKCSLWGQEDFSCTALAKGLLL